MTDPPTRDQGFVNDDIELATTFDSDWFPAGARTSDLTDPAALTCLRIISTLDGSAGDGRAMVALY